MLSAMTFMKWKTLKLDLDQLIERNKKRMKEGCIEY